MSAFVRNFRKWWWIPAFIIAVLTIYSFKPLPKAEPGNCDAVRATVLKVDSTGGVRDIALTLAFDDAYYYINHGLDNGLKLEDMRAQLVNKTVMVYYIKHWSLFNLNSKTRHVARVEVEGNVVYNEWETTN